MSSRSSFAAIDDLPRELNRSREPDALAAAEGQRALPPRVLVVEDDTVISHLIDHLLTRSGFAVDVAPDGRRAQELMETLTPPSLVILDVMLPFVGGFELIERLRAKPLWAKIPILMLTSKSHQDYVVRAFGAGVDDYVTKPFRPEELIARVRRLAGV